MNSKAIVMFYGLATFVLGTTLFVMQPTNLPEMQTLKGQLTQSFSTAWQQTIGDQPYFGSLAQVYEGTTEFYNQASVVLADMIHSDSGDEAIAQVFGPAYHQLVAVFDRNANQVASADGITFPNNQFMSVPAIENLIPDSQSGNVAGASISAFNHPADNPWFTATDGLTGQKYCVAIYNGEVNKYLGTCENEYR